MLKPKEQLGTLRIIFLKMLEREPLLLLWKQPLPQSLTEPALSVPGDISYLPRLLSLKAAGWEGPVLPPLSPPPVSFPGLPSDFSGLIRKSGREEAAFCSLVSKQRQPRCFSGRVGGGDQGDNYPQPILSHKTHLPRV